MACLKTQECQQSAQAMFLERLSANDDAARLLGRFAADIRDVLPLAGLWAHGSLASGDYVPGRSDLDLVALACAPVTSGQRDGLQGLHEKLISDEPLAVGLHCAYMVSGEQADPGRTHLTWAHGELYDRPVSPVTRRELGDGGVCLFGPAPATLIPAVTDTELADYVRANLRDYWYPKTSRTDLWRQDIWVDLGVLTLARAQVTLREGRLITKREALDVLATIGAPAEVVSDIRDRRYRTGRPLPGELRARRGELARAFIRAGIDRTLRD
jgi:hypothetical protein